MSPYIQCMCVRSAFGWKPVSSSMMICDINIPGAFAVTPVRPFLRCSIWWLNSTHHHSKRWILFGICALKRCINITWKGEKKWKISNGWNIIPMCMGGEKLSTPFPIFIHMYFRRKWAAATNRIQQRYCLRNFAPTTSRRTKQSHRPYSSSFFSLPLQLIHHRHQRRRRRMMKGISTRSKQEMIAVVVATVDWSAFGRLVVVSR